MSIIDLFRRGRPDAPGSERNPISIDVRAGRMLEANADSRPGNILRDSMPGYAELFEEDTITPLKIKNALGAYRSEGKLQGLGNLFQLFLDVDDNLQSAMDVRRAALKGALWSFGEEMPEAQAEFFDQLLQDKLAQWVDIFMEGKLMGYHFYQIMWEQREDGLYIPAELVNYQNLDLRKENRELVLYEQNKPRVLPEFKFIKKLYRRPIIHSIIRYYVFYSFVLNNWSQFLETYGKPLRLGKYDPMTTSQELNVLRSAVKSLGTDQAAIISRNTEIDFKDFANKATNSDLHKVLCDFVSEKVTRRVLGQTLTTGTDSVGSYAMAQVHNLVREDIQQDDLHDLKEFVDTILDMVDRVNWGGEGINLWLELPKQVNLQERIAIDGKLHAMGLPMSQDYYYDTYGVDRPRKDQELMPEPKTGFPPMSEAAKERDSEMARWRGGERETGGLGDGETVTSLKVEERDVKSLAKLQRQVRACKNLEELRAFEAREFIKEFGRELTETSADAYIKGRKGVKRSRQAQSTIKIKWEWDTRSIIAVNQFRNSSYIVSGVRTRAALKVLLELAEAVVNDGGSFADFMARAEVAGFTPKNPHHWLTEFETAKVATRAAGQWHEFQETADLFPYLQYLTMEDDLVRDEHRILHGVIAEVGDEFWQFNYPPNGWNCRCYAEQLTRGEAEGSPGFTRDKPGYVPPEGFRRNVGEDGQLPGGAEGHYDEFAQGPEKDLFSFQPDAGKLIKLQAEDGVVAQMDSMGYPVLMGEFAEYAETVSAPSEIWQAKGVTHYLRRDGEKVTWLQAKAGRVESAKLIWKDEYHNEGREGFQEY